MVQDEENELAETSRWCGDAVNCDDENESGSDTWKEDPSMDQEPPARNDSATSIFTEQAIISVFPPIICCESTILRERWLILNLLQPIFIFL